MKQWEYMQIIMTMVSVFIALTLPSLHRGTEGKRVDKKEIKKRDRKREKERRRKGERELRSS